MKPNRDPENGAKAKSRTEERGATLLEYALLLSLVLVVLIVVIDSLGDAGTDLLNASSNEISSPRPQRQVVLDTPLTPPPSWASTTIPPSILTWAERPIATSEGCVSVVGSTLEVAACGSASATPLNGLSNDGLLTTISVADGSLCLTGNNSGPSPTVSMQPCDGGGQEWREVSSSGPNVTFQNEESGLCLQTIVPAAPEPLTMSACDGSNSQSVQVQF